MISFKANWMVDSGVFTNSVDGAYCFIRYGYRPYQAEINCQDNPLNNDAGFYPSTAAALTRQAFYSVSHRSEIVTLAELYRWATLKRVTWTARPKLLIQAKNTKTDGTVTTAPWTGNIYEVVAQMNKPIIYYSICHVERNPRNTDTLDSNIAGINLLLNDNTTTRVPVISWPDEGADAFLSSNLTTAAGSQDFNYFHNMRMIRKTASRRGVKATWRPWGGKYGSAYIEKPQTRKLELRAMQAIANGTATDDAAAGTGGTGVGVEDDYCYGGFWLAIPTIGFCGTFTGETPAPSNTQRTQYLISCSATYSFYGRY